MFALLALFLTSLLAGYFVYQNTDQINTKAYTNYQLKMDTVSQPSQWTPGTLPIANTEGGTIPSLAWAKCPQGQVLVIDQAGNIKCESDAVLVPGGEYFPYQCDGYKFSDIGIGVPTDVSYWFQVVNMAAALGGGWASWNNNITCPYTQPNTLTGKGYTTGFTVDEQKLHESIQLTELAAFKQAGWAWTNVWYPGFYGNALPSSLLQYLYSSSAYTSAYPTYIPCGGKPFDQGTINRWANTLNTAYSKVVEIINRARSGQNPPKAELYVYSVDLPLSLYQLSLLGISSSQSKFSYGVVYFPSGGTYLYTRVLLCLGNIYMGNCNPGDQYDPNTNMCTQMIKSCSSGTYDPLSGKCTSQAQKAQVKMQVN
ncbi:MAG: hypothetical protein QW212_01105 [Nitrososphaerales archaeon]